MTDDSTDSCIDNMRRLLVFDGEKWDSYEG